jgi:AcrR family transcriptional regulator
MPINQLLDKPWSMVHHQSVDWTLMLMPEPPQTPPPARKRELVEAAFTGIAENGFEGLRTRHIAEAVGVNIATLHYYFPTKEALVRAVLAHAAGRFAATFSTKGSPAERLRGHLAAVREVLKHDTQLSVVMGELVLRARRDPAMATIMDEIDQRWHTMLRELVARGVEDGSLRPDLQPDSVAAVLVAACRGVGLPSPVATRAARIDQTFNQLQQWLGLAEETSSRPRFPIQFGGTDCGQAL